MFPCSVNFSFSLRQEIVIPEWYFNELFASNRRRDWRLLSKKDLIIGREETSDGNESTIRFRTKLKSQIQTAHEYIIIRDNNLSIITTIPIKADEDHRLALAEYLTRVNYNMWTGNFELDMTDGEIRFKEYAFVGDGLVQIELIASIVFIPLQMMDLYSGGILSVLFDFKMSREAYENVSN